MVSFISAGSKFIYRQSALPPLMRLMLPAPEAERPEPCNALQ